MSISLVGTVFSDRNSDDTYGFRMYDEYAKTYDNTFQTPIDDDLELFKEVMKSEDEVVQDMVSHIADYKEGIWINGTWYFWEDISKLFCPDCGTPKTTYMKEEGKTLVEVFGCKHCG